jgi:hypothetical protein
MLNIKALRGPNPLFRSTVGPTDTNESERRMMPNEPSESPRTPLIDEAIARLRSSLSVLEAAAARRAESDRSKSTLETELALMQDDRARLAVELDGALARANRLDTTTDELSRRIERAIGSVRSVIEAVDPPR